MSLFSCDYEQFVLKTTTTAEIVNGNYVKYLIVGIFIGPVVMIRDQDNEMINKLLIFVINY